MTIEKSCGAVVYTKENGNIRYLLIQNLVGVYGFPKGHMEGDETEIQTALREVNEEVGLDVELIEGFRTTDSHPIPQRDDVIKDITYFLGYYEDQTPVYQQEELTSAKLYSFEEAIALFQYESTKRILTEANEFLLSQK